ncbi:hypothetical protein DPMN_184748 [Dreissena polymorpha]|uniref:Uncharacterized protein n=1 Tax=Dreissena polymorpha TaxID=45954 RepID=A0A9D4DMD3_DREPO|nr:hypothetical protein DPMN_184748 [Dreissena polymorpha]
MISCVLLILERHVCCEDSIRIRVACACLHQLIGRGEKRGTNTELRIQFEAAWLVTVMPLDPTGNGAVTSFHHATEHVRNEFTRNVWVVAGCNLVRSILINASNGPLGCSFNVTKIFHGRASPDGAYDSHHFIKSGATTPGNKRGTIQLSSRDITLSEPSFSTPNFRTNYCN